MNVCLVGVKSQVFVTQKLFQRMQQMTCFLYIRVGGLGHTASFLKMVLSPSLVLDGQLVVQPQLPLHAILGDNCHPTTSSRAAVPPDCLGNSLQNQILALFLGHILPVCVVHHTIEVGGSRATNSHRLTHAHAANRHTPHLPLLVHRVVSGDNQTSHQAVPVLITDLLEGDSSVLDGGRPALLDLSEVQLVLDNVGDGLGVRSRAGPAAENAICDWGEFVSDSVCDPRAHAGPAVCADDHTTVEFHCYQSCSSGDLLPPGEPVLRDCLFAKAWEVLQSKWTGHFG